MHKPRRRGTREKRRRSHLIKCYSYATWSHVCLIPLAVSRYANTDTYSKAPWKQDCGIKKALSTARARRNFLWRAAIFTLQLNVDYKMLASGKWQVAGGIVSATRTVSRLLEIVIFNAYYNIYARQAAGDIRDLTSGPPLGPSNCFLIISVDEM